MPKEEFFQESPEVNNRDEGPQTSPEGSAGSVSIKYSPDRDSGDKSLIRWKNRQRMAWYSFYAMIIFTVLLWFVVPVWYTRMDVSAQEWTENITDSAEWIYITFSGIILGYMGSTAWMVKGKNVTVNEEDY
jgi:hypothetical protein